MTEEFIKAGTTFFTLGSIALYGFEFFCLSYAILYAFKRWSEKRAKKKQEVKQSNEEDTK